MRQPVLVGIAALLAGMPATGQIIQRMERDVVAGGKLQPALQKAPLLDLTELKQIALFRRFGRELRSDENGMLRRTALRLSQGDYALARKDWESALAKMKEREFEPDVDALVRGVLQQAYIDKDANFQPLATAVQFREQQREAADKERADLERMKAVVDEGKTSDNLRIRPLVLADKYAPGVHPVERAAPEIATAESVAENVRQITVLSDTADDNAHTALLDLQRAVEGKTLQTMSNVSKMLHDTAKAIINNTKP